MRKQQTTIPPLKEDADSIAISPAEKAEAIADCWKLQFEQNTNMSHEFTNNLITSETDKKPSTSTATEAKQATRNTTKPTAADADKRNKKPKRRMEDEDGFIFPAKHLIARGTPAGAGKRPQISTTNTFLSTNPTPEVADEEVTPTEQAFVGQAFASS
ncbi:hypothetical protein CEXT_54581 [Caerostris extrusa]|uniref:Uncharacterized protein n=1 Tax=Caerostris extrusa TaxID=172846 RepID=A0AAV4WNF0_CAEEX|nr:hypothetical protein CEXT_54581 [Caerostris extrusa]